MTWWAIGLKTTSDCSPPLSFTLKIGILIAHPQFLIRDAQKGDGLFISSDYEMP